MEYFADLTTNYMKMELSEKRIQCVGEITEFILTANVAKKHH